MRFKASTIFILSIIPVLLLSCKSKQIDAATVVNNEHRINYYKPFFESARFNTKILALSNINAVYTAANNFNANEMFIVDTRNDSLYMLKSGLKWFHVEKNRDVNLLRNNMISAKKEDIENFKKLKKFLNTQGNTQLVYSSNQNNDNGNLEVYFIYTTDISDKIKQENLPMNNLTDIKELVILDISTDGK